MEKKEGLPAVFVVRVLLHKLLQLLVSGTTKSRRRNKVTATN